MRKINIITSAAIFILFGAQAAHAGPVIALVSAIASIPVIGNLLISLAVNAITNKIFGKKPGQGASEQERSVLLNKQSNNEPIPVVYGRRRLGGTRAFVATSNGSGGAGTNTLNMVVSLCEGECGDIHKLFFNDTLVWDRSQGGGTTGTAGTGYTLTNFLDTKFTSGGSVRGSGVVVYHPGTTDQAADATLVASSPEWTSNHRLRGVAYLAFRLGFDAEAYESGLPVMTAIIDGKKIVEATNPLGSVVTGENMNYADVIHDYMTNPIYGKNLSPDDIDLASFASARSYFAGRFNFNGVVQTGGRIFDTINELLYTCNGMIVFSNGKYKLLPKRVNETSAGKKNFNRENIIGDVTVALPDIKTRFNRATVDFNNKAPEVNYNEDVVIFENTSYVAADGGRELDLTVNFPFVVDQTEATQIATSLVNQSRNQTMIALEASHTVFPIEAGEIITVTLDDYDFDNTLFRVVTTELTTENTIRIVAQKYVSSALI